MSSGMNWDKQKMRARFKRPRSKDPSGEQLEAKAWALDYKGDFAFMLSMRRMASDYDWWPSPKQAAAILRCRRRAERSPP